MSETATASRPKNDRSETVQKLLKHLAGSTAPVRIGALPDGLREPAVIAVALRDGFVQIGHRTYCTVSKRVWQVKDELGRPKFEPLTRRPVMDRETENRVENEWSWTNLQNPALHKTLRDVLLEDAQQIDERLTLHLRLTSAGLAET